MSKPEVFAEVSRQLTVLGRAEFELAFKRVNLSKADSLTEKVQLIKDSIHSFREPFIQGVVLGPEGWNQLYSEINDKAALELSKSTNERISALQAEQAALESSIASERAALKAKYAEFDSLPAKAAKAKADYAGYAETRNELSRAEQQYEELYAARCLGSKVDERAFFGLVEMIVSRPLKLKVIDKLEAAAKKAIADLRKRNNQLAQELGRPPYDI
jgi:hypothetical protein